MRVIVIRHHAEDSAGFIGEAFEALGAELITHLFPGDGEPPELDGVDHVLMLGAVPSIYADGPDRWWIDQELAWLHRVDEAGLPILGICFGAQELCTLFGGRVEAVGHTEVGWVMVDSLDPTLIPAGPWLEFHSDRCLPPEDATILARNETGVQAFSVGRHLAVQFHPEVDGQQLRGWMEAGAREQSARAGQEPDAFLAKTIAEEPAARARADVLVGSALWFARSEQASALSG
jgi:GMP synthase-like glutamine amidotransferase